MKKQFTPYVKIELKNNLTDFQRKSFFFSLD